MSRTARRSRGGPGGWTSDCSDRHETCQSTSSWTAPDGRPLERAIVGEGPWAAAEHGARGKRGWKKLHLGVGADGVIVAQMLTDGNVDDARTGVAMIEGVRGRLVRVTADPAYDTHDVYAVAGGRGAAVVIPPIAPATVDTSEPPRSPQRDATVRRVGAIVRRAWKRESGYHRQGAVENAFLRWKTILGPALRAREEMGRQVEARLGGNILNWMREVAWPDSASMVG